jgi:hypothetical protein
MIIKVSKTNTKSYTDFLEKSSALIHKLIIGQGDAKSRLGDSEFELTFLLSFDVPEHLKKLKERILKSVSKKPTLELAGKVYMTSFRNSISNIRNSTASEIIDDIYSLHLQVSWYQDEKRNKVFLR